MSLLKSIQIADGSAIKSNACSSRGPSFDSQNLHGGSQLYVILRSTNKDIYTGKTNKIKDK